MTINKRLAQQIDSSITAVTQVCPDFEPSQIETTVSCAAALLTLDGLKHCLHTKRLLQQLYLAGIEKGVQLGIESVSQHTNGGQTNGTQ